MEGPPLINTAVRPAFLRVIYEDPESEWLVRLWQIPLIMRRLTTFCIFDAACRSIKSLIFGKKKNKNRTVPLHWESHLLANCLMATKSRTNRQQNAFKYLFEHRNHFSFCIGGYLINSPLCVDSCRHLYIRILYIFLPRNLSNIQNYVW